MDAILNKLFKKYFVFKISEDWKDELKKIPEELLKDWMDNDLFKKIDEYSLELVSSVIGDAEDKWNNEIWMDINEFVNEYELQQEIAQEKLDAENDPEESWFTDDDDTDDDDTDDDDDDTDKDQKMYCPDVDPNCNCEHSDIHEQSSGCFCGCAYATHTACLPYKHKPMEGYSKVPDEITETGGL